jgi:hypothetical protein
MPLFFATIEPAIVNRKTLDAAVKMERGSFPGKLPP